MKTNKIIIGLLVILMSLTSYSQSIFDKYEDLDDVTSIVISKHAFRLMKSVGGDSQESKEFREKVQSLENLTVYTTNNIKIASKMKADVKKHLKSSSMSELMRIKDKKGNVKMYVKEGKDEDHIKELFMVIDNMKSIDLNGEKPQIVIVSLVGDIDLKTIGEVADKLNIPGADELKKAKK